MMAFLKSEVRQYHNVDLQVSIGVSHLDDALPTFLSGVQCSW